MTTLYQIIESIASNPSTNVKQAILEANKDNELLKKAFLYAESPRIQFWVRVDKDQPLGYGSEEITLETFRELDKLANRSLTGDAARNHIAAVASSLTPEAAIIFCRIINKDLRCGAGTSIANKVWKGLIAEYPCMLCEKMTPKTRKYLEKFERTDGVPAFAVQSKKDGGRVLIKVDGVGNVTLMSRNGSTLNTYGHFDKAFTPFFNTVFDGELLITNKDGTPNRKLSNGIYTKLVRNTATQEEVEMFSIVLWDIIPLYEYLTGQGTQSYDHRFGILTAHYVSHLNLSNNISIVETKFVSTLDKCMEFYDEMRARGEEGSIIKVISAMWSDSRSKDAIKLKNISTADLLCIGTEEGTGKYVGKIGSLICQTSDGKLVTNVGTGLKDADREKDPNEYLGKVLEIEYNETILAKNSKIYSLFLPVFKQVRYDKTMSNTFEELK